MDLLDDRVLPMGLVRRDGVHGCRLVVVKNA